MTADETLDPNLNEVEESVEPEGEGAALSSDVQKVTVQGEAPEKNRPNIATFRGVPKKLHESLKRVAEELGISPGELARYFLEYGLDRIEAGEEDVAPQFVPGGYTLYPEEGPKRARRKGRRKRKAQHPPRSYYGVPRELVKQVLTKSQSLGVTQGELARYLFERGLDLYQEGKLALEPVPVQQIATLYPEDLR